MPDPVGDIIKSAEAAQEYEKNLAKAAALKPNLFPNTAPLATKKEKTEAERALEKWQEELDKLSGREAISVAEEWRKKVAQIGGVTKLAAEDQQRYNAALSEGLDAQVRRGRAIDSGLLKEYVELLSIPNVTRGLNQFDMPGEAVSVKSLQGPSALDMAIQSAGRTVNPADMSNTGLNQSMGNLLANVGTKVPLENLIQIPKGPGIFAGMLPSFTAMGRDFGAAIVDGLKSSGSKLQAVFSNIAGTAGDLISRTLGGALGNAMSSGAGFLSSGLGKMLGGALSSALPILGDLLGGLVGKLFGPTEYEKRTRAANEARTELKANTDMGELQRQADFTGRGDLLAGVTSGFATGNSPDYIKQLMGELNVQHEQLNAAMDRYGISWEQLGEKAKQSQINQMAEQFILDFQVLTQAGADVNFVIEKMGSSVNEFIATAIRTGTEVPIGMQPMLQKMLEMGTLVDANGLALTDLSSITFAESLTMGFSRVVEAINHLSLALGYGLPAAAESAAAGMNAAFSKVRGPDISPRGGGFAYEPSEMEFVDVPQAARGGIVRARSGGTLVNVGEGGRDEAIVPLPSSPMRSGAHATVVLELDGQVLVRELVPLIPGECQRLGLA